MDQLYISHVHVYKDDSLNHCGKVRNEDLT